MAVHIQLSNGIDDGGLAVIVGEVWARVQTVKFVVVIDDELSNFRPLFPIKEFIKITQLEYIFLHIDHHHHEGKFVENLTSTIVKELKSHCRVRKHL